MRPALIVMGPTASGKSALAIQLAQRHGGTIINADAMQCYRELRILTARPTPAEQAATPHELYGIRPAATPSTAAWWCGAALAAMADARLPILCGGTGMYLNALIRGLAPIPDPGEPARAEARALLAEGGPQALHAQLAAADPATAARLRPTDSQRIARAWEVLRGTGQGLAHWQQATPRPNLPYAFRAITLLPPRETLRQAIATRWHAMLAAGAIQEVAALSAQQLPPATPALRAHGVPELAAYLAGSLSLDQASARAILAVGQYTKRQATWLKHHNLAQPGHSFTIDARWTTDTQFSLKNLPDMTHFLAHAIDAKSPAF